MTTIVAVTKGNSSWMGAEQQTTSNSSIKLRSQPKVVKIGGYLVGSSGPTRLCDILQVHMPEIEPKPKDVPLRVHLLKTWITSLREMMSREGYKKNDKSADDFDGLFLVAKAGEICVIFNNFSVWSPEDDYYAIGSGEAFALGSLETSSLLGVKSPKKRIELALHCSIKHDVYSSGKITILKA